MKRRPGYLIALGLVLVCASLLALGFAPPAAKAQERAWSVPRLIFEGPGQADWPFILADEYGQVHAFWTFLPEGEPLRQLFYTRLDESSAQPVDIMAASVSGIGIQAAQLESGLVVAWSGALYRLSGHSPQPDAKDWARGGDLAPAFAQVGLASAPDGTA